MDNPGIWTTEKKWGQPEISRKDGDFPGGPVAKTLLPYAGGLGLLLRQGTRSHMPQLKDPVCFS